MGKAVTSGPIRTLRACCALRVVHPFFVRASDNPVRHNSGTRCVGLKKGENLFADINILAYVIAALGVPALEKIRFVAFLEEHTHNDLASQFFIGSIEGNCSNREPSKARSEFPVHPRAPERFFRAKSRLSFHLCNIRRVAASCRKRTMALFSPGAGAGAYSGNALGTAGIVRNGHLPPTIPVSRRGPLCPWKSVYARNLCARHSSLLTLEVQGSAAVRRGVNR